MPMVETNLETVRNPTNLFVGGCQLNCLCFMQCDVLVTFYR